MCPRTLAKVASLRGDELEEAHVGPIIGDVDGLVVRHYVSGLLGVSAQGVPLGDGGRAIRVHLDLNDVAVLVGPEARMPLHL